MADPAPAPAAAADETTEAGTAGSAPATAPAAAAPSSGEGALAKAGVAPDDAAARAGPAAATAETGLPLGWEVRHSRSKNLPYYFNARSKESRWEPPADTDPDKLKVYMAEHHTLPPSGDATGAASSAASHGPLEGKIRAAHLLVKHAGSRRPASWKEPNITRTEDEAMEIITEHERRIRSGEISLGELAMSESDCTSARKCGDLGYFGRGDMQKEFEDAAFALEPGEISTVVTTASGLHLIERLE